MKIWLSIGEAGVSGFSNPGSSEPSPGDAESIKLVNKQKDVLQNLIRLFFIFLLFLKQTFGLH